MNNLYKDDSDKNERILAEVLFEINDATFDMLETSQSAKRDDTLKKLSVIYASKFRTAFQENEPEIVNNFDQKFYKFSKDVFKNKKWWRSKKYFLKNCLQEYDHFLDKELLLCGKVLTPE